VWRNGTLTTSSWLKLVVGLPVCRRTPFAKHAEGVTILNPSSLCQHSLLSTNFIDQFVSLLEFEGDTDGFWNGRLGLAGQLAGDDSPRL
jgi:hypothetical protein